MVAVNSRNNSSMRSPRFDLVNEVQAVIEEILRYKWLESEKRGHDIGMRSATREWIENHYDDWFEYNRERFFKEN